jgi:hypothetical protein
VAIPDPALALEGEPLAWSGSLSSNTDLLDFSPFHSCEARDDPLHSVGCTTGGSQMQIGEPSRLISIAPLEVPGEPSALTAPPRLRVTLSISRQPEESCGTLVRDRIRLDRFPTPMRRLRCLRDSLLKIPVQWIALQVQFIAEGRRSPAVASSRLLI